MILKIVNILKDEFIYLSDILRHPFMTYDKEAYRKVSKVCIHLVSLSLSLTAQSCMHTKKNKVYKSLL